MGGHIDTSLKPKNLIMSLQEKITLHDGLLITVKRKNRRDNFQNFTILKFSLSKSNMKNDPYDHITDEFLVSTFKILPNYS